MKKIVVSIILGSLLLVGCSGINEAERIAMENITFNFFFEMNHAIDEGDNGKLSTYFTEDSEFRDSMIQSFTTMPVANENEVVNYKNIKISKISTFKELYKVTVYYDVIASERKELLYGSSLNLYLKEVNGEYKIESADYGG